MRRYYRYPDAYPFGHLEELDGKERIALARELLDRAPALAMAQRRTLAHIRKAAVKDAINAASLYKVVVAAKQRKTPSHLSRKSSTMEFHAVSCGSVPKGVDFREELTRKARNFH